MRSSLAVAIALVPLALACSSTTEVSEDTPPTGEAAAEGGRQASAEQAQETNGRTGVLVPASYEALSIWPEAYRGELLLLEVLPQGAAVTAGDVIATLDLRAIEEAVRDAELDVASALIKHEGLIQKNQMAEESAASKLARTEAALARAQRSLEGWKNHELVFAGRSDEVSRSRQQNWVDDQQDELDQLERMYEADELTDETEEIVLKRSRRDLAMTQTSNQLSEDQRQYTTEYTKAMQTEQKEEAVHSQEEQLAHLVRTQELERLERQDAETRSAVALEKKRSQLERLAADLEMLTLRAPRDGILLHGKLEDYRPGGSPRQLERGDKLSLRADVLMIAEPGALAVALDVPESMLAGMSDGSPVVVRPVSNPEVELGGNLEIGTYPGSRRGEESVFKGIVTLEGSAPDLVVGMHAKVAPVTP